MPLKSKLGNIALIFAVICLFSAFIFLYIKITSRYILKISVDQVGSKIAINDKYFSDNSFENRLPKGNYTIVVTKEGFLDFKRDVYLNKNTDVKVILLEKIDSQSITSASVDGLRPYSFSKTSVVNENTLGIDTFTGNLIMLRNTGFDVIYKGKVNKFSYRNPFTVIVDSMKKNVLILKNILTNEVKEIPYNNSELINALSITPDLKNIILISDYNVKTNKSTLYSLDLNTTTVNKIGETKATDLQFIDNNMIAMFISADYLDRGTLQITDRSLGKIYYTDNCNKFLVSPTGEFILLQLSNKIKIIDTTDYVPVSYNSEAKDIAVWEGRGNAVIVFRNSPSGVQFAQIQIGNSEEPIFNVIPSLTNEKVIQIYGVSGGYLYFQNSKGENLVAKLY